MEEKGDFRYSHFGFSQNESLSINLVSCHQDQENTIAASIDNATLVQLNKPTEALIDSVGDVASFERIFVANV